MNEHVRIERSGGVMTIRLDRPEKKNALTRAMYGALADALAEAAGDDAVRVALLAGGTDFTAGNDIADFAAAGEGKPRGNGAAFDFLEALVGFEKPVLAAVRGHAVGIGTTMLLHCDAVVASESARFMMPFTRLALVPEAGSSLLLAARVGTARASWWLLSGAPFSGVEAAQSGFATLAVPDEEVETRAAAMAEAMATLPPGAVQDSKRLIRAPTRETLRMVMDAERASFARRLVSEEAQAAFAAFLRR